MLTMPETSDTTMYPLVELFIVAVNPVEPDVPVEPNPTQSSAVPLPDWPKPATCCQLTPPPAIADAWKPEPELETVVPIRATSASPPVTPVGRFTENDDPEAAGFWFSWTTLGAALGGSGLEPHHGQLESRRRRPVDRDRRRAPRHLRINEAADRAAAVRPGGGPPGGDAGRSLSV